MNKLEQKAQKSKLNVVRESTTEKLLTSQRKLVYPVSFRLDVANWERLNKLLEKVNQDRSKKINLTQLLKALIYQGQFLKKGELEKGLKEEWKELRKGILTESN
ncbi:3033_t:CDS:2 [Cetraspora pellucida]|uniref:3033_t:CDS:1 n=1 Tax=Cetraspora pellucida TaxID=1433469 RepID=A0ACA9MTQ8_9GLOM|nr:3033_t:CDS:2 [Cetraspora pellucida]